MVSARSGYTSGQAALDMTKIGKYMLTITATNERNGSTTKYKYIMLVEGEGSVIKHAPAVTDMLINNTVILGQGFNINGTVTAYGSGKLKKVTILHNEVGSPFQVRSATLSTPSNTFDLSELMALTANEYPLNTPGIHEFIVYAAADNYTVTDNAIFKFYITVTQAVSTNNITSTSEVNYDNVYAAIIQILEAKNDKRHWYTPEFLHLVLATAWTESSWAHYKSDGTVKINDNGDGTYDIGIMQLNDKVLRDASGEWLVETVTTDWLYNLEYGIGNIWTAYKAAVQKYGADNTISCARGAYSRYNGGPTAGVTRWASNPIAQDNNFYRNYSQKPWEGNYSIDSDTNDIIDTVDDTIPVFDIGNALEISKISVSNYNPTAGDMVTVTADILFTDVMLSKVSLQWYNYNENHDCDTFYRDTNITTDEYHFDVSLGKYVYSFSAEIDTSLYTSGTYRIYAVTADDYCIYDESIKLNVKNDNSAIGSDPIVDSLTFSLNGMLPINGRYQLTDVIAATIDNINSVAEYTALQLVKDDDSLTYEIGGQVSNSTGIYSINPARMQNGIYSVMMYSGNSTNGILDSVAFPIKLIINNEPPIKINVLNSTSSKSNIFIGNNIPISVSVNGNADYLGNTISYDTYIVGVAFSWKLNENVHQGELINTGDKYDCVLQSSSFSEAKAGDIIILAVNVSYSNGTYINKEFTITVTEPPKSDVEKNSNAILNYKTNAINLLSQLKTDGTIDDAEYEARVTALGKAFDMATFVWQLDGSETFTNLKGEEEYGIKYYKYGKYDTNAKKYETRTFKSDYMYFGLPYTQGYSYKNQAICIQSNRFNDVESVLSKKAYISQNNSDYIYIIKTDENGYYGNDCSAFVCKAWNKTNRSTSGLISNSKVVNGEWHQLTSDKLRPGDVLCCNGHVVMFLYFKEITTGKYQAVCIEQGYGSPILDFNKRVSGNSTLIPSTIPQTVHVSTYSWNGLINYNSKTKTYTTYHAYSVYNNYTDISSIYYYDKEGGLNSKSSELKNDFKWTDKEKNAFLSTDNIGAVLFSVPLLENQTTSQTLTSDYEVLGEYNVYDYYLTQTSSETLYYRTVSDSLGLENVFEYKTMGGTRVELYYKYNNDTDAIEKVFREIPLFLEDEYSIEGYKVCWYESLSEGEPIVQYTMEDGAPLYMNTSAGINGDTIITFSLRPDVGPLIIDINGDGHNNVLDVIQLQLYIKQYLTFTPEQVAMWDVDGDSDVDYDDVIALQKLILQS